MKLAYLKLNAIAIDSTGSENEILQQFSAQRGKKAIIIGAGPSGLAAGISLRAQGWHVLIAEKRTSFTRDTVVGINKAALGWFAQHDILAALNAHSSKTAYYPTKDDLPNNEALLDAELWLKDANTSNTILTKMLQKFLYEKYSAMGGWLLSDVAIQLNATQMSVNDWQINVDDVDLIIGADGANSATRQYLMKSHGPITNSLQDYQHIPTHEFANVIVDPKPDNLPNGIYFHLDAQTKYSAAISVSDYDVSLNFQTDRIAQESTQDTAQRIVNEAKTHLLNFLDSKSINLAHDCHYYPINAGKIISDDQKNEIIVSAPSYYATQMVFGSKFILIGDAKGVSSPRAGLGASLGVAYDATVIELFAKSHDATTDNDVLFALTAKRLKQGIDIWAQKTMDKIGIKADQNCDNRFSFWQQQSIRETPQESILSFKGKM